jgi:2TM domain
MTPEDELRQTAKKRIQAKRQFWEHLVAFVVVNAGLIGIWAVTGGGYFWPGWVLFGWGIGLVMHAWVTFVERPVSESDIQREMERMRGRKES